MGIDRLDDVLPSASAVIVCVPATPETVGLLDARRLHLVGPDAVLVNVSRAAVVDEAALFAALRDGRLFAAGLDVWYRYPGAGDDVSRTPAASEPFHELPNVVMSPHRAGHVADTERLRVAALAEILHSFVTGRPLPGPVDVTAGY